MAKSAALLGGRHSRAQRTVRRTGGEESGRTDTNYLRAREIPILFTFGEARRVASSET